MFVKYWNATDNATGESKVLLEDRNEEILMKALLERSQATLSTIEIETINRCNNDCSFCPANRNRDIRKLKKMDDELFRKIVEDLVEIDYKGRISLFSNDEPLLDDRICKFAEYVREKLPKAYISLFTNGILLNRDLFEKLVKNLDYLRINNYNDDLKLNENISDLQDQQLDEYNCLVEVEVRKKTQVLLNRGGLSPNNNSKAELNSPCILPFVQMVIRPDGNVSRCCQDVYGNTTLGNVATTSVWDVWNGEAYKKYRMEMINMNRQTIPYCNVCDMHGLFGKYPSNWEFVYFEKMLDFLVKKGEEGRRIALVCVHDAEEILKCLHMKGIENVTVTFLGKDMQSLLQKGDFVVWGADTDTLLKIDGSLCDRIGRDVIVYQRNSSNFLQFDANKNRRDEIREIHEAEKADRLVIFGAGYTSKRIIEALKLNNYMVVDNYKVGESFMGDVIVSPNNINNISNPLILIAAFDYVPIVKQLNDMGISSLSIRMGYRFLR